MHIYMSSASDIDIPRLDLLSLLFDSQQALAQNDTLVHVDAARPSNNISKHGARKLLKQTSFALRDLGIGASGLGRDAVLTVMYGSPFAPIVFYGVVAAGGVYTGASTESTIGELDTQIKSAKANLLICSRECLERVRAAAKLNRISPERILVMDSSEPGRWTLSSASSVENLLDNQGLDWPRITDPIMLADTTICLLYSSGTTGLPKGVRLSHANLVANTVCTMEAAKAYQKSHPKFRFDTVAHLPMSNIAGIGLYSCNPLYMGGTTYWMRKFDFDAFIECHRRFRPAYQFSVPPIWLRVAKSAQVTDHFDGLMVASTGSAPIGFSTINTIRHKLGRGKADIYQTWGTTETTGVITAQNWEAFVKHGTWSVGEPCPNTILRVVDDDGNDVEDGGLGELLVGGPFVCQGYLDRPDANREAFGTDGFYRTGDIGMCKDGLVQIVDRKKELIKYKATQVAPAELEAVLTSHPSISDAAVIGVFDQERQTEVPKAYVVRTTGESITVDEIMAFMKSKLSVNKQLRGGVVFVEQIPKSASGKILRKELRAASHGLVHMAKL